MVIVGCKLVPEDRGSTANPVVDWGIVDTSGILVPAALHNYFAEALGSQVWVQALGWTLFLPYPDHSLHKRVDIASTVLVLFVGNRIRP